ncbi:WXG100 family type VII secretion target [Streptomyces sp. NPDC088400]|uniref:WXG100 family type VII secretion target n=1 Tax=Streptomyces sp. NPDC088400 TaxID=3365861 RepID=UPI00382D3029
MSNKDLNVTSEEQVGLAGKIQTFHDELQSRITSLNGVVDRIQAGWQGAASKEYDAVQERLNTRLRNMRVKLIELEETMRMSADGFTQQEQDRIKSFRTMDDSAGGQSAILGMA